MKLRRKVSALLTLVITLIGSNAVFTTPAFAATSAQQSVSVQGASPVIGLPSTSLPVGILAAVVCLIFVVMAISPLFFEDNPAQK